MKVPPMSAISPPPMSSLSVRPPTRPAASITITDLPAAATLRAAVSPAMPAPTTITSAFRRGRVCLAATAVAACAGDAAMAAPAAAPVAPALISLRRVGRQSPAVMPAIYGLLTEKHLDVVGQVLG